MGRLVAFGFVALAAPSCSAPPNTHTSDLLPEGSGGTSPNAVESDGGTSYGTGGSGSGGGAGVGGSNAAGGSASGGALLASGGFASGGMATGGSGSSGGSDASGGTSNGGSGGSTGNDGTGGLSSSVDPNFHIFLLLGQSNMDGVPKPEALDLETNENVRVLAFDDCTNLGRKEGQWYTAQPPLHRCYGGVGPGDWFGKKMAEANPEATIGLVPCALPSADIDAFRKGVVSTRRSEYVLPPDDGFPDAYEWVLHRAQVAQESGVIRGILLHQGESDTGKAEWIDKVQELTRDLRTDLNLGEAPLLAGELVYGGCCDSHNSIVAKVATEIANGHVISAQGLAGLPDEPYHFDLMGQRTMGQRYGEKMLEVWMP